MSSEDSEETEPNFPGGETSSPEVTTPIEMEPEACAELFLQQHGGSDKAVSALTSIAKEARPRLRVPGCAEHLIVALPESAAGAAIAGALIKAIPGGRGALVNSDDEVVICYETPACPLQAAADALLGRADVPGELVRQVMTRTDVPWYGPIAIAPEAAS